ncbi:hypothetical protein BG011_001601 [Mortierella polycephala]|uniref:YbaK/aminoacyl-tRNA synthetase-associated domain-containing protein n=1 Tax=Mortierella polycephala TaxID=41804 RepID=A0A9P6Q7X7_9FUNG|nr:hypothetical protein BG011_001601 [Mortierella polycephala]
MPEPTTVGTSGTQLMADAHTEPALTLEDFLAKPKTDVISDMPDSTLQASVYKDAHSRLPSQCQFLHVSSDYYDWPYVQRARVMGCASTFQLCKSLIFENTRWKQDETKAKDANRYWCVIVQYEGSVNVPKLEKAVRERTGDSRKGMHLRIAPAEKSHELTGFTTNGVSPVGMKTDLPILVSTAIAELSPPVLYLGAGHVDWKIALPVQEFIEKWNANVIDFS